jgi:hypothetical protein
MIYESNSASSNPFRCIHSSSPSAPVGYNTHTRAHGRDILRVFCWLWTGCSFFDETLFELPPLF